MNDFVITCIIRGKLMFWGGVYGWGPRTYAHVYSSVASANRAIERQKKLGRWLHNTPRYCTIDELFEKVDDDLRPLDMSDPFWLSADVAAV